MILLSFVFHERGSFRWPSLCIIKTMFWTWDQISYIKGVFRVYAMGLMLLILMCDV